MKSLIFLSIFITIFLTGCNNKEVNELNSRIEQKEEIIATLKQENKELTEQVQKLTENQKPQERGLLKINDKYQVDLDSVEIFENPKLVNYDVHLKLSDNGTAIMNTSILCDEATSYIVSSYTKNTDMNFRIKDDQYGPQFRYSIKSTNPDATKMYEYCF